jgi:hypothetical protein
MSWQVRRVVMSSQALGCCRSVVKNIAAKGKLFSSVTPPSVERAEVLSRSMSMSCAR